MIKQATAADHDAAASDTGSRYAISHWPDTDDLVARGKRLIAEAPRPVRRERMAEVLEWFETRCRGSKEQTARAAQRIPGGVQHNLAFNYPFPLSVTRADGPYLWDVDGNRYIDFLQAGGPTVLGSNYPAVRDKVIEVLRECGPVTGLFHEYELKLAELIHRHMPAVEMFRMLGSGTEACMAAVRAARNFTGNAKVIKVGGAYHGWSDQMVLGTRIPGSGAFEAAGIPADTLAHTQEFYPNDIHALRALLEANRTQGGTAAVLVEPIGPESGSRPVQRDFNGRVRELCDEFGALLVFDEVVTGFRLGMGGAQGYFGVRPDLTVFGKCIAGGFPAAGGVGGRADVMSTFAAGIGGGTQKTLVGGTLSANPISSAAGYFAILEMERTDAPIIAGRAGDRLAAGLQAMCEELGLPFFAYNHGSIVHLETHGVLLVDVDDPEFFFKIMQRKKMGEEYGAAFTAAGIITLAGSRLYTSMADTDDVIDDALARFRTVLESVE
ncbi:MAG TPA: aminotransferase class III-fold pyridoxal phosphate-dependent enzyme [Candidatus Limnocylindrales bacterium]|nr:aminotransferase class III-fold pyridoxal phosphate-dependent enzyme [Candidatus Limnocylindrales bacterium]